MNPWNPEEFVSMLPDVSMSDHIDCTSAILSALTHLYQSGPTEPQVGICFNVKEILCNVMSYNNAEMWRPRKFFPNSYKNYADIFMHVAFQQWEKFSGTRDYPVPVPEEFAEEYIPLTFYNRCVEEEESMWDGKYGDLRKELLTHMIDCATLLLDHLNQPA